jgi:hypothetical protein
MRKCFGWLAIQAWFDPKRAPVTREPRQLEFFSDGARAVASRPRPKSPKPGGIVTADIPPYCLAVGDPASVVRGDVGLPMTGR